jgi:hypothetical protein
MRNPTASLPCVLSALLSRSSLQAGAISCTIRRQSSGAAKTQTPALHKYLDWWHDLRVTLNKFPLSAK